jgi:hypothetical protein
MMGHKRWGGACLIRVCLGDAEQQVDELEEETWQEPAHCS